MQVELPDLPSLPHPLGTILAAAFVLRCGVIPMAHALLGLLRDVRRFRAGR